MNVNILNDGLYYAFLRKRGKKRLVGVKVNLELATSKWTRFLFLAKVARYGEQAL